MIIFRRPSMRKLSAAILFLAALPLLAQEADLLRHFDYDQKAPLDIREAGVEHRGAVSVHDISYASPKGGRVPAYLVVPDGKGPFAAVLWGHWYMPGSEFLNRKEFLAEAVALAPAGVVSLLTDGPIARPGHVEDQTPLNENEATDLVQQIVDMRFKAFVLMAGSLSDEVDMKSREYQDFRQKVGPEKFDAFAAKYSWLDP